MPILITSRKDEIMKRKNMEIRLFLLFPITYRNLFVNDAIRELPILEDLTKSRSRELCLSIVTVQSKAFIKS